jgi:hypothetical protein
VAGYRYRRAQGRPIRLGARAFQLGLVSSDFMGGGLRKAQSGKEQAGSRKKIKRLKAKD